MICYNADSMVTQRPAPSNGGDMMRSAVIEGWVEVLCHRGQQSEHHRHGRGSNRKPAKRWATDGRHPSLPPGGNGRQKAHCKVNGKSFATGRTVHRGAGRLRHGGTSFVPPGLKGWGKHCCWNLVSPGALGADCPDAELHLLLHGDP